ncbi:hypothetical protein [Asanoa iriomotensis]|uniref:Protein phosphatase 2C-like protein n=1 Tax=Asanoa iriomotensis TaxID=234613 RepID=A0ABQ4C626_9ACTN|nr:hypothetical protein [Asanoa iriomotensis]GIF58228.1 hypothetical protein Air01nite_43230 [Asanoa iriomotensis]
MEVRLASAPAPGRENEDIAFAAAGLVGVLDGVTAHATLDSGCLHGPAWYVQRLAGHLLRRGVTSAAAPLAQTLAEAIELVRDDHGGGCDLNHPNTPAATVTLLRTHGDEADYLVLCDSPLVIDRGSGAELITDDRFTEAVAPLRAKALAGDVPIGSNEHAQRIRAARLGQQELVNRPDGYWIAAANPEAAAHAVEGSVPLHGTGALRRAALLTDGASCIVDQFGLLDWSQLLDLLTDKGPQELIDRVRAAEAADGDGYTRPRYKRHDDATAAICLFD